MKTVAILGIFFSTFFLKAQVNLVPNPSFENYSSCPTSADISFCLDWTNPTTANPDLINACASTWAVPSNPVGYQAARTGVGYLGLVLWELNPNYREYIQVALDTNLIAGKNYCVSFYVSRADSVSDATDAVGVYFSPSTISSTVNTVLNYTPQVINSPGNLLTNDSSWTLISGIYLASGGERYITIGNFSNDSQTNTQQMNPPYSGTGAYYFIDDVSVTDCGWSGIDSHSLSAFTLSPNPSNGTFQLKGNFPPNSQLHVYNLLGEEVVSPEELPVGNNTVPVNLDLAEGIYFYNITSGKEILHSDKLIITR